MFCTYGKTIANMHEEVTAIVIEPMVQCAAGMKIYSPKYLMKLRELCDKYDINLIADEIAVGFGRTGKMFACEHANISPDIMCLSKGLTAGYISSKKYGYVRFPHLKKLGDESGGRIFLYDSSLDKVKDCLDYIEKSKTIIRNNISQQRYMTYEEFLNL